MTNPAAMGPGKLGYGIALAALLVGLAVTVVQFLGIGRQVSGMSRATMPGIAKVTLPAGESMFYAEPAAPDGKIVERPELSFECASSAPDVVTLARPSMNTSYDFGDHSGRSVFTATAKTAGDYTLSCTGTEFVLAWGAKIGAGIVATVVSMFGGFLVAFVIAFMTWRRRRAWRRGNAPG